MTDEQLIRDLIERWAGAAHDGDLPAVLADHAPDIVMFDVPPPEGGVRGLDAYRETWPGFFDWQACGAVFELESLEITAGTATIPSWTRALPSDVIRPRGPGMASDIKNGAPPAE